MLPFAPPRYTEKIQITYWDCSDVVLNTVQSRINLGKKTFLIFFLYQNIYCKYFCLVPGPVEWLACPLTDSMCYTRWYGWRKLELLHLPSLLTEVPLGHIDTVGCSNIIGRKKNPHNKAISLRYHKQETLIVWFGK